MCSNGHLDRSRWEVIRIVIFTQFELNPNLFKFQKYCIDSGGYFHVSRACHGACQNLDDANSYDYEGHSGKQYCCNGYLCNSAVSQYTISYVGFISMSAMVLCLA